MDFELPADLHAYLRELDDFIDTQIKPLQQCDDNQRFFDHRREWARTDFDNGGLPRPEWEALLNAQMHGGIGCSRHKPFVHTCRHHRRCQITEGADVRLDAQLGAWPASMGIRRTDHGASHGPGHALGADAGVPHGISSCVL